MAETRSGSNAGSLLPRRVPPPTRPLRIGDTVTIYQFALIRPPLIEGRATLLDVLDPGRDLYRVRFVGEGVPRERLVHPGSWQADPDAMLRALLSHWRDAQSPENCTHFLTDETVPPLGER